MRLLTVTVMQRKAKYQLAQYFYGQILSLPHQRELDERRTRWGTHAVMLESHWADPAALQQPKGGFTGIQVNVYPMRQVHRIVNDLRGVGYKQPDARLVGGNLVASVQDPTGNAILVVGHQEPPDEALANKAIGGLTVFVSNLAKSRTFYEEVLGIAFKAAPVPGLLVFGEPGGTALMLYQAERGLPETPVGRLTPYTFGSTRLEDDLSALERSEATIVERAHNADTGALERVVFKDPERNTFTLVDEALMQLPVPVPVAAPIVEGPNERMDRGAALELDDIPVAAPSGGLRDDVPPLDRELELD